MFGTHLRINLWLTLLRTFSLPERVSLTPNLPSWNLPLSPSFSSNRMSRYDDEVEEDQELEPYELTYVGESKKRGYASKDGKAVAVFSNADTYEGDYKAHKRNGKGTCKYCSTTARCW